MWWDVNWKTLVLCSHSLMTAWMCCSTKCDFRCPVHRSNSVWMPFWTTPMTRTGAKTQIQLCRIKVQCLNCRAMSSRQTWYSKCWNANSRMWTFHGVCTITKVMSFKNVRFSQLTQLTKADCLPQCQFVWSIEKLPANSLQNIKLPLQSNVDEVTWRYTAALGWDDWNPRRGLHLNVNRI